MILVMAFPLAIAEVAVNVGAGFGHGNAEADLHLLAVRTMLPTASKVTLPFLCATERLTTHSDAASNAASSW
jgi:hypothetical protein